MDYQTSVMYQNSQRITIIFQKSMRKMIEAQSEMLKNYLQPFPSCTLIKQIALFLYYGLMNPIANFDYFVNSQKSRKNKIKLKLLSHQQQFRACFNNQSKIIDQQKAYKCQKVLIQLLIQSGITLKQKKQINLEQMKNMKIEEKVLNHLFYFFKLNFQHKVLCNSKQDIFPHNQIARIFNFNEEVINYLNNIYCEKSSDFQQPYSIHKRLIYFLFVIKLRLIISKQLQTSDYPKEEQVQTQLLKIRQFYMNHYNQNMKNNKDKDRFSIICMNDNDMNRLRYSKRKLLLDTIKDLIDQGMHTNQKNIELQKISLIFNVKKKVIEQEYKRIKNDKGSKINQLLIKVNQFFDRINYQRWKQPRQSLSKLFLRIPKLGKPKGLENFLEQHCKPQMAKLKTFQRESSRKIKHQIINQLCLQQQQVLFIEYSIFYQQQLNDYNILLNNKSLIKSSQSRFVPANDAYLYLITGITNKRVMFYSIIEDNLTFITYLKIIKKIILKSKIYIPRIIMLNISLGWKRFQWEKLSELFIKLQKKGHTVLFSFNQQYSPSNINFEIRKKLKYLIITNLHNKFSYEKKEQLRLMAKNIIHLFFDQFDFYQFIRDFFRKEYSFKIHQK